jgi:Flp pilus assembly protein TadG
MTQSAARFQPASFPSRALSPAWALVAGWGAVDVAWCGITGFRLAGVDAAAIAGLPNTGRIGWPTHILLTEGTESRNHLRHGHDNLSKLRRLRSRLRDAGLRGSLARCCAGALRWVRPPASGRPGLLRDRRGATALVFATCALVIIGCVGLGTEVGIWYLVRREAQNTADASAIAGALSANDAITAGTDAATAAQAAGTDLAAANGFTQGATTTLGTVAVVVNNPPSTGTHTSVAGAVEVYVSQAVTPLISGLFGGTGVTVGARSVAVVEPIGPACALSLTGDLTVSGTLTAFSCGLASNASDSTAINVTGSLEALTVAAVGGCSPVSACAVPPLFIPAAAYHPATPNPYSTADAVSFPTFAGATCATSIPVPDPSGNIAIWQGSYETSGQAYCTDLVPVAGQTLVFRPGTYIFYNASFTALAGTIECQYCDGSAGVSIVFLGTGTLTIEPGATISTINAAASNSTFPALSGLLFYGRGTSPVNVSLLASGAAPPAGAFYFPNASLTFTGSASNPSPCLSLVAGTVNLYSTFTLIPSGCTTSGTSLAQMQGARIVE